MNKWILLLLIVVLVYFFFFRKEKVVPGPTQSTPTHMTKKTSLPPASPAQPPATANTPPPKVVTTTPARPAQPPKEKSLALPYVIDGDLAVVQGDIVVGALPKDAPETGRVVVPELKLWPSGVIPYHIQPTVTNPDRVRAALAMFQGTNVQFVPYTNQEDAIVFEDSTGVCKSYVGRVGGLQPIFIPAGCGPHEVAHEIMHALGFVHEQNRTDRDDYIQVLFDNIDPTYKDNFEKLPQDYMKVSGLASFDFESIMIYPAMMFALGSRPTMQPLNNSTQIQPSFGLSKIDIQRINQAYSQ